MKVHPIHFLAVALWLLVASAYGAPGEAQVVERVRAYLATGGPGEREAALSAARDAEIVPEDWGRILEEALAPPKDAETGRLDVAIPAEGGSVPTSLYVPSRYTPKRAWPVHIALHPRGIDGGTYLEEWTRTGTPEKKGLIVLAPSDPTGDWPYTNAGRVLAALDWLRQRYRVDPDRISVGGFSSGSDMAWLLGLGRADRFSAIVGRGTGAPVPDFLVGARHVRVVIVEGKLDTEYHRQGRSAYQALKKLGYDATFLEHGGGHLPWTQGNDRIADALLAARRPHHPREISALVTHPAWGRIYWLQVLSTGKKACVVHATREGNRVTIDSGGARRFRVFLETAVDFEEPVEVEVDGVLRFRDAVREDPGFLLDHVRETRDPGRVYFGAIEVSLDKEEF